MAFSLEIHQKHIETPLSSSANFSNHPKDECCSNGWAWRFPPKVFEPLNFSAAFEWVHGSHEFMRSRDRVGGGGWLGWFFSLGLEGREITLKGTIT